MAYRARKQAYKPPMNKEERIREAGRAINRLQDQRRFARGSEFQAIADAIDRWQAVIDREMAQ